jgi:hypothetical protein
LEWQDEISEARDIYKYFQTEFFFFFHFLQLRVSIIFSFFAVQAGGRIRSPQVFSEPFKEFADPLPPSPFVFSFSHITPSLSLSAICLLFPLAFQALCVQYMLIKLAASEARLS